MEQLAGVPKELLLSVVVAQLAAQALKLFVGAFQTKLQAVASAAACSPKAAPGTGSRPVAHR